MAVKGSGWNWGGGRETVKGVKEDWREWEREGDMPWLFH